MTLPPNMKAARIEWWYEGDRVTINPVLFCSSCRNCITGHTEICLNRKLISIQEEGALAEYVAISAKNLSHLPESVPSTGGRSSPTRSRRRFRPS